MDTLKNFLILLFIICSAAVKAQSSKPPIAIPFNLTEAGYVTLVVENENGQRVRNLVAETWFKAGKNIAYWDGLDDLGRDTEAARHGVYHIPSKPVPASTYRVNGIVHQKINTSYEFSVYTTGNPPWNTADHTGAWLANQSAPQAAAFVPASQSPTKQPVVFLGSYISEGPDGFAWVDLNGKKLGGRKWLGGAWTAAPFIARDAGQQAAKGISVYVASVWETGKKSGQGELRLSAFPANNTKPIFLYPIGPLGADGDMKLEIGGLAVRNGIAVVSLTRKNKLLLINVKEKKVIKSLDVVKPMGLTFNSKGELLILSEKKLYKINTVTDINNIPKPSLINGTLLAPVGIATDDHDRIYISDAADSHQVKVFSSEGVFISAIGKAGVPKAGPYDPLHMNNPAGLTIDSKQQLWVAENDYIPKRVSVWTLEGKFIKAFYGPGQYGGGGTLDPHDKTKFYYAEMKRGSMEFKLDWETGESKLQKILYRKSSESMLLAFRSAIPETPLYVNGRRYFTNAYNSNPISGHPTAYLFAERGGKLYPAAAMGRADTWDLLKEPQFKPALPIDADLRRKNPNFQLFFIWTDLNEDGKVQPSEVSFKKGAVGGVTVMPDLAFCISQVAGKSLKFAPVKFTDQGTPIYQMSNAQILASGVQQPGSSGGDQALSTADGWAVITQGISPFGRYSISGTKDGKPMWSYPNMWPGLHASHTAPLPDFSGELIGTTRLLGGPITTTGKKPLSIWAINSNHGMVYIFTNDGLFVTTLFNHMRAGKKWSMPTATRKMDINELTLGEENFWPSITQTEAGEIYLVDGARSALVKVDGLQSITRLPAIKIEVSPDDLKKSLELNNKSEAIRQENTESKILKVLKLSRPLTIDGKLDDWKDAEWASIDSRGVKSNFNSKSAPFALKAAIAVSQDKLYASYKTGEPNLLKNSGETPLALFKTGSALDLMIGSSSTANPKRTKAVEGDLRIIVTQVNGKPRALIYRAVVTGAKQEDKVPFSSPSRTITFDQVEDIAKQLEFAEGKDGNFEIAIPLSILGLIPKSGVSIKGDIGVIRGDGYETISRTYWSNKATAIVSDVPSEAELTPNLWGTFIFSQ
jgi:hypothetical protein